MSIEPDKWGNLVSFREKSAWISLLLNVAVYGYYVWRLWGAVASGQTDTFEYGALLIELIVALVIAQIALNAIAAAARPKEAAAPRDERERLIDLRATTVGYVVALGGAVTVAVAIADDQPAFYTANGLFLVVVLAESARSAGQIFLYRRDA